MKYWLVLIFITSNFAPAIGQDTKKNIIKVNALGLVFGLGSVIYERQLTNAFTVSVTPSLGVINSTGFDYKSYGIGGEFRYYLLSQKQAPKGLHIGAGGNTLFGNAVYDQSLGSYFIKSKITGFNTYLNAGYQFFFKKHFTADIGGGVQYIKFKFHDTGEIIFGDAYKGFAPNAVLSVGYAF
ncbi:MAG: hypothetical protein ABIR81_05465 [Ginsengibacter sp.]